MIDRDHSTMRFQRRHDIWKGTTAVRDWQYAAMTSASAAFGSLPI